MFVFSVLIVINSVFSFTISACEIDRSAVQNGVQTRTRRIEDNIRFDCNSSQDGNQMIWQRRASNTDESLFAGRVTLRSDSRFKLSSANYSLFLNSIEAGDEGEYICKMCGEAVATYRLRVISDLPELHIQHDGANVTETIVADKGTTIQLDCVVFRAIEEPSIAWSAKNSTLIEGTEETTMSPNEFVQGTFDFRRTVTYLVEGDTDLVCSSMNSTRRVNISVPVSFEEVEEVVITEQPQALPELRIQYKGKNVTGTVSVKSGTKVRLDCVVFGASEEPAIVWQVKNTTIKEYKEETFKSPNRYIQGTSDFGKTLVYVIENDTELICSSLENSSIIIAVTSLPRMLEVTAKSLSYEIPVIAAVCVIAFIVCAVGVIVCVTRYREIRRSTVFVKERTRSANGRQLEENMPLQRCHQPDREANRNKSTRTLPQVPNGAESYAHKINEEDHYSVISNNLPRGDVFSRQRICMIQKLSDGVICERWIGNVTASNGDKKYAFISCLKGVIRNRHIQWEGLVKKISELPECSYIFKAQGICLDEPHLFLLQDYVTCEPLNEYVSMQINHQQASTRKDQTEFFTKKFTEISLQVTYGMEFLMTHGLAHPGLSVKKILISDNGVCKLYDFCLAEDAPKFMQCLKLDADFKPSSHPQECMARNEYSRASDVWYTAFTVREIYAYGSQQDPLGSNIYYENSSSCSLPSGLCPPPVFERLTKCLTQNYKERAADLKELLKALKSGGYFTYVEPTKADIDKSNGKHSSYEQMKKVDEAYNMPLLVEDKSTYE